MVARGGTASSLAPGLESVNATYSSSYAVSIGGRAPLSCLRLIAQRLLLSVIEELFQGRGGPNRHPLTIEVTADADLRVRV